MSNANPQSADPDEPKAAEADEQQQDPATAADKADTEASAVDNLDEESSATPADDSPVELHEGIAAEQVIEAVLFSSENPLPLPKLVSILGVGTARDARKHINSLNQRYEQTGASFRIENVAGGYQMLTLPVYNTWLRRLKKSRQESKLSQAAMETLAVVAYKQPVVRADIEAVRGVAAGEMLNRLRELGLVKIVGRAEDVGRPMLYGTTKRFLEAFGLAGLEDLPEVEDLQPPD